MARGLRYCRKGTFLHNLHPFSNMILLTSLGILGATYWDLRFLLPLVIIGFLAYRRTGVPSSWLKSFTKIWIITTMNPLSLGVSIFMVNPAFYKVLPYEFVSREVIQITPNGFPVFGYSAITYGTLYYWASSRIRVIYTFMMGCLLVFTLSSSDLIQALAAVGVPSHFVTVFCITQRFASILIDSINKTMNAMKVRGWKVQSSNPAEFLRESYPLALALGMILPQMIEEVARSISARGFGSGMFINWREPRMRTLDYVIVFLSLILLVVTQYMLFVHRVGLI